MNRKVKERTSLEKLKCPFCSAGVSDIDVTDINKYLGSFRLAAYCEICSGNLTLKAKFT